MMITPINKKYCVFLLLILSAICFSQSKVYTDIQKNKNIYPGKDYTFDKVIDARANKDNIGLVYKSDMNQEFLADLKEPVDAAFLEFLNNTFPNGLSTVKITMVINSLEIGHKLSGRRNDSGYVKANFDFYKAAGESSVLIHHYENMLVDVNDNIALTHSNRLKRIILLSVSKLDSIVATGASYIETIQPDTKVLAKDSVKKLPQGYSKERLEEAEKIYNTGNYPRNIIVMLGGHAVFCTENQMFGANGSLLFRFKNRPKSLLGFNVNYSIIKFQDRVGLPENVAYSLKTADAGLRFLRQIKNVTFFSFNPHFMFGKETFVTYNNAVAYINNNGGVSISAPSTTTKERAFYGSQFDTGVYLMSPKKAGAYMGVDFVLRFTNSFVFETDMGLKFNFGIAF